MSGQFEVVADMYTNLCKVIANNELNTEIKSEKRKTNGAVAIL